MPQTNVNAASVRGEHELLDPVVAEAMERFQACQDWESQARKRFIDDYKFANADVYNGWQWPNEVKRNRDVDERPCLTLNQVRQHNLQIKNDIKQNKPAIKVMATGGGATYDAAQVLSALVKHIEYQSRAAEAYMTASDFMVDSGWGYLRLGTRYVDEKSNDQEIVISRVKDPLTVYLDRECREFDCSDAKYGFCFEDVLWDEFKKTAPKHWQEVAAPGALGENYGWTTEETIRKAEYYRKVEEKDRLYALKNEETGEWSYVQRSVLAENPEWKDRLGELDNDPQVVKRDTTKTKVEYFLILGTTIVERRTWPGSYIPIIPVRGEVTVVEGVYDCRGNTRAMIDPQRMYNYWSSAAVEYGALQSKTPYIGAAEAIEGYETYWNSANQVNYSILPYKATQDDNPQGGLLPPPQRQEPPVAAPVALQGMQTAQMELMLTSGQMPTQAQGVPGERTALQGRDRRGMSDNATYHFQENLGIALGSLGRQIVELIPIIYDTKRVMMILAEDDSPMQLVIDPKAQEAAQKKRLEEVGIVQYTLNPNIGRYSVQATVGPGYATKREEAFEAFKLILTQNPTLTAVLGDILFRAGDFPLASEAAQRLRRLVPPHALGEGPSQAEQALTQQVQQLQQILAETMNDLAKAKLQAKGKEQQRSTQVYTAFTERLRAIMDARLKAADIMVKAGNGEEGAAEALVTEEDISRIFADLTPDLLDAGLAGVVEENREAGLSGEEPMLPFQAPEAPKPPGVRYDYMGQPYGRDFSQSKAYRPI